MRSLCMDSKDKKNDTGCRICKSFPHLENLEQGVTISLPPGHHDLPAVWGRGGERILRLLIFI